MIHVLLFVDYYNCCVSMYNKSFTDLKTLFDPVTKVSLKLMKNCLVPSSSMTIIDKESFTRYNFYKNLIRSFARTSNYFFFITNRNLVTHPY